MAIPVNIEKLISGRTVESERIEYKKGWNPAAIYRTICAFANDFENIGGGYIIVGAEEEYGRAKRPITGIPTEQLDAIQKEMIGYNNLIRPYYAPKIDIQTLDGQNLLIIWAPAGMERPYEVPENIKAKDKKYQYYIRKYASTVQTAKGEREELFTLVQRIPFDDRPNQQATIDDISPSLVREYLVTVESELLDEFDKVPLVEIYRSMDLLQGSGEMRFPKNIALMMFNFRPDNFFPYSRIEIVEFPKGLGDPTFYEKPAITGPIHIQIQKALEQLENIALKEQIYKRPDKAEAERVWSYPFRALEETVVNSVYHRSYEIREPIEIRILPDVIEIINYGGPDRSIKLEEVRQGIIRNRRYRNRRIGDFLKELNMTEGRGTGIPIIRKEMTRNGSPEPRFETDENYSYFMVTLPIHPAFRSDEGVNDGVSEDVKMSQQFDNEINVIYSLIREGVSEGVNEGVNEIIDLLLKTTGLNAVEIAERTGKSLATIERYLRILRKKEIIEFRGAPKTGGYYFTAKVTDILNE
jgi:ATP-dependent DNA helicase RecG